MTNAGTQVPAFAMVWAILTTMFNATREVTEDYAGKTHFLAATFPNFASEEIRPDYFAKYIAEEMAKYGQIIKDANIRAE